VYHDRMNLACYKTLGAVRKIMALSLC